MEWLDVMSNGCIFFTIVMFATGIPQCLQMFRQKKTANIPFLPYLMTNVNNVSWIIYGQMTNNFTVLFVNVVGSSLQSIYMAVHTFYCDSKKKQVTQSLTAGLCVFVGWIVVTYGFESLSVSINITGFVCCIITILMFASPLAEINTVITEQSTARISFPLTVASFLCGGSWTLFGMLLGDSFIVVPNALGVVTSVIRFFLFHKYPSKSQVLPM
uniref:Sugar transporter SWEET1 n=1 Tax=Phallusia mammillata TaxID=59560 RepID=A0A6F9DTJ4_9ASCI|nr:sugar transporter SWEET1 [Phallusia mammillata]